VRVGVADSGEATIRLHDMIIDAIVEPDRTVARCSDPRAKGAVSLILRDGYTGLLAEIFSGAVATYRGALAEDRR
jgi:hypothetical protein